MMRRKFPVAVVISGPSGAGKSTLIRKVLDEFDVMFSVSHTTRKPRPGEINGKHYFFVSESEFRRMIENDEFLEWAVVHGNLYGTHKSQLERAKRQGKPLILDVDVKGALSIREKLGKSALLIFIKPPSLKELERRLRERGDTPDEQIKLRIRNAKDELKLADEFDFSVENRDVEKAYDELRKILLNFGIPLKKKKNKK